MKQKKAAKDAEIALKLSQQGKRKASQPVLQSRKRQKHVVNALDITEVLKGASAALAKSICRGRNVKLPDRFK